jgi:putative inorganic carbon (HCO3(-)) transporter
LDSGISERAIEVRLVIFVTGPICLSPVGALKYFHAHSLDQWIEWWGRGLFLFLVSAVFFLGIGEVKFEFLRISAWSVSRTTFGFWLLWKLASALGGGRWRADWMRQPIPLALLIFFIAVALSLLPDFHASGDFRYFLFGCAHAVMVMDLFESRSRVRLLLLLLALSPGLLTLRGILDDPSLLTLDQMHRFGFPLDHPNTAGYLFSMSIPLAMGLVIGERGGLRWLSVASCAAQLLGLILTYSRGAWLGCGAAMLFLLVTSKRWKALLCILAVPLLLFIFVEPLRSRVLTLTRPEVDVALRARMEVIGDAIRLGLEHPITGTGYGRGRLKEALRSGYQEFASGTKPIWHAHNVYVELFADTGAVGLMAFLWLLGRTRLEIARRARRGQDADRIVVLGVEAAWIAAAVTGLGDVPFYHHETRIFFFTLLALAFACAKVMKLSGPVTSTHGFTR